MYIRTPPGLERLDGSSRPGQRVAEAQGHEVRFSPHRARSGTHPILPPCAAGSVSSPSSPGSPATTTFVAARLRDPVAVERLIDPRRSGTRGSAPTGVVVATARLTVGGRDAMPVTRSDDHPRQRRHRGVGLVVVAVLAAVQLLLVPVSLPAAAPAAHAATDDPVRILIGKARLARSGAARATSAAPPSRPSCSRA